MGHYSQWPWNYCGILSQFVQRCTHPIQYLLLTCNNFVQLIRGNWRFLSSIEPTSSTVCPTVRQLWFHDIFHHFPNNNAPFHRHQSQCPDLSIPFSVWANRDSLQAAKYRQWPDAVSLSHTPFGIIHFQAIHIRCDRCAVGFRSIESADTGTEWFRLADAIDAKTAVVRRFESIFSIPKHFAGNRLRRRQNDVVSASNHSHRCPGHRNYHPGSAIALWSMWSASDAFCFSFRGIFSFSVVVARLALLMMKPVSLLPWIFHIQLISPYFWGMKTKLWIFHPNSLCLLLRWTQLSSTWWWWWWWWPSPPSLWWPLWLWSLVAKWFSSIPAAEHVPSPFQWPDAENTDDLSFRVCDISAIHCNTD